jgi:probable rRNA maturation factor
MSAPPHSSFVIRPSSRRTSGASRSIAINNAHPRLRLDRPALRRALATLDAHFTFTPADLSHLTSSARQRDAEISNLKSQISNRGAGAAPPGDLSLAFLTDPALAALHAAFLNDPTSTDVITFEGNPAFGTAGEICVSVDTAATYAARSGHDFARELLLYVIHGWLHLVGYDDLAPAKKRRMRAAESRALALLADAPPIFSLRP